VENQGKVPTSYITLNQRNGSRTIIHYRELAEFNFSDFQKIDLSCFDWIHFEGRNVVETAQMVRYAKQQYPHLPISIEIEKLRVQVEQLFDYADVLLFSQVFAQSSGYYSASTFLRVMRQHLATQTLLVCAWGTDGGYLLTENRLLHSPAYPPPQVVDTIAAGDTFNAGIISGLCNHVDSVKVLKYACQLAGKKCGQIGLSELHN
jgi:ketohexokinase